jgi:hypothetical protein
MELPDVNILINAFRQDLEHHPVCIAWLSRVIVGDAPFALSQLTLSAVVRVTTNSRLFRQPSTLGEVLAYCQSLMDQPNCRLVEPGARHWSIFERLCRESNILGPMVTDAWFAALAIEHGCEWITLDRDFSRFSGLRWRSP